MLLIDPFVIESLNASASLDDLHLFVQKAIELEHSTIPPYLTAELSIKPGTNKKIGDVIHTVVIQEMLHFTIACNILNAIGGSPDIFNPSFVPDYPSVLPMNIHNGLKVGLEKYSTDLVEKTFMEIEEPEAPLIFPEKIMLADIESLPVIATIGQFYKIIQAKILELAEEVLPGDSRLQVVSEDFGQDLFPILTKSDALRAIDIIVEQGEGTDKLPTDQDVSNPDEIAHYYRFQQLVKGKMLVPDNSVHEGFSFTGALIDFDAGNIFPIKPNTKIVDLPLGSAQRSMAEEFNVSYSNLLKILHRTFNGEPALLSDSIDTMFELKSIGKKLVAMSHPSEDGLNVGPTFEFVDV